MVFDPCLGTGFDGAAGGAVVAGGFVVGLVGDLTAGLTGGFEVAGAVGFPGGFVPDLLGDF